MDSTTSKLHSQAFDLLRFPLSVLVVCEHLFGTLSFHGISYDADNYSTVKLFEMIRSTFFSGADVPVFFLISGFLFFYNVDFNADVYKRKIKSRVKTLFIPYIIWNTIAILMALLPLIPALAPLAPNATSRGFNLSFTNILSCYWNNNPGIYNGSLNNSLWPINAPLWYIRDLMIAVLLAPAIYYMMKKFKYSIVLLFGAVWFIFSSLGTEVFIHKRIAAIFTALFFFYWGAYMSINKVNMMEKFGRLFRPALVVYLLSCLLYIASTYYFSDYSMIIHKFTILSFVFVTYDIAVWLLKHNICKVSKFLAGGSFIIYVVHGLFYPYVDKILLMVIHPINNVTLFAIYILTLVITVLSLLGVYYLLKRFAPPVLKVLTGRC
jgi:peptidoglycan/LPS O-acetylase OafA/YrhL